ncbi:MAG: AsmA family protein [Caldimonas sp.]
MSHVAARIAIVAAVLVAIALASQPWWLGPLLGAQLSKTAGREVHFDSVRVGLTLSLAPIVVMRGVRIANAPWADTSRPFAALEEVVFQFSWRRFEDRWVVSHMILRDGEVNLARQADGLRNWRLRDPEDRGPGHYWFCALEPHRATLRLDNGGIDLHLHTSASDIAPEASASTPAETLVNRIDFDGAFRELAFKGSVATGPVLTFLETDRWFPVRGSAEIEGARLEVDGRTADIFRATQIDAQATLSGKSLAALRPFVGDRYAEPRAFRAEGHLTSGDRKYALSAAHARIGATDLDGDLAWSGKGERRTVSAALRSDSTDLGDLLWLAGRGSPGALKADRAAAAKPAHASDRDAFASARDLDADVSFDARRFRVAAVPAVQSLKLKAVLADGALAVSNLDVGWAGGHSTGTLALDLRQHPALAEAAIETRGVQVETLFAGRDEKHRITGTVQSRLALKAAGDNAHALRASATGTISAGLAAGTIPSMLDALMGLEGGKVMRTLLSGTEALSLPCAAVVADVGKGNARIRSLVVDSANTRITGSGTINLLDYAIDLTVTPEPKRPGLFELRKSIRLSGHLPKPERALVDRVAPLEGAGCEAKP